MATRGGGPLTTKNIAIAAIVVVAVWFILVNRHTANIYLWVPKVQAPMWLVILITFIGGVLTGVLLTRRGGRKQKTADQE